MGQQLSAQCPHCRAKMQLQKPELVGKTARCPACKEAFVIKLVDAAPAASSAPAVKKSAAAAAPQTRSAAVSASASKPAAGSAAAKPKASSAKKPTAPAKPDIDFDVEVDDVFDAEVIEDDQSEEDWLTALDSLEPKDAGAIGKVPAAAAPVVQGRPKKEPATTTKKRKRRWRDADGEFPVWLSRTITVAVGGTVGLVTTMIWAGMISRTGGPIVIFPMFIGATVGTGVRLGASKYDFGLFPAVTAAMLALVAIIGGKVWGVSVLKHQQIEQEAMHARYRLRLVKHEDYPIHLIAEEIRMQNIELGESDPHHLWEPAFRASEAQISKAYNPERLPEVYGADRWNMAKARWEELPDGQKREYYEAIDMEIAFLTGARQLKAEEEVKRRDKELAEYGESTAVLSVWDFIVAAIAVVVAFKIAAGMTDSQIDMSHAG